MEGGSFTQIHQSTGRLLGSFAFWYITAFFVFDFYKSMLGHAVSLASGESFCK